MLNRKPGKRSAEKRVGQSAGNWGQVVGGSITWFTHSTTSYTATRTIGCPVLIFIPASLAASNVVKDALVCLSTWRRYWPISGFRRWETGSGGGSFGSNPLVRVSLRDTIA